MQRFILSSLIIAIIAITGCKKDNYKPPTSILQGQVSYQGQPIGLRSNGVQLELWQHGFEVFSKIPVYIAQDGTFSASLFDGDYKLVLLRGNGPWINSADSMDVKVNGNTTVDVTVTPYFLIKDAAIGQSGTNVNASFTLQQVNTSLPLEAVRIYLGATTVVDQVNSVASVEKAAADIPNIGQPIQLTVNIPSSLSSKGYLFARIGVKTAGVAELLYTMPQKIELK
ncbi:DUF3823 domain-containing protein [Chitinophaga agrisoli]|uniref:DUF3823 domain-containing protein n=1 Tax=Chitinophaga agrisoli TaxID=2607653 RepID=A0A5B2VIS8_9BACT|nr:DUF3823 domain-containing protein [Chitinophaga agrisoli]KAA2239493.1 DUF3823 domain-containing protein [Chitinophaga agrisoli]